MSNLEAIARDYLEAFNSRDWEAMRSMFAPNYTYTGGDGETHRGPEAGVAVAQMWASGISDAKITIDKVHVAGDTAIVEFHGGGTHDGDLMGIPATGRRLSMPVVTILDIKDGKITAEREFVDTGFLMQQLGVVEAPTGATA